MLFVALLEDAAAADGVDDKDDDDDEDADGGGCDNDVNVGCNGFFRLPFNPIANDDA